MTNAIEKLLDYAEGYARTYAFGTSRERLTARNKIRNELAKTITPLDIKPPNAEGATQCVVRYMAETEKGWVGSYDREALEQLNLPRESTVRLFLDTEFNGFGGKLISIALVPEVESEHREFYKELETPSTLDPWVRDNVIPHLVLPECTMVELQQALAQYLFEVGDCTIVADWPDDIKYFCELLITGPGSSITLINKIKFELDLSINYVSKVPHNALHDARAIRDACCKLTNQTNSNHEH